MLEISNDILNGVLVIHLSGRLDGISSKVFIEKTATAEYSSHPLIVINCKDLNYISSEGLRALLMSAKHAKSLSGNLTLCNVNNAIHEVFLISGFAKLLGLHASINDAVKHLTG